MPGIYVCGHGGWGTIGRPSVFTTVPAGAEVVLYTEIGSVLYVSQAVEILSRSGNAPRPVRTIGSRRQCPDLTLYPAQEFWNDFGRAATQGGTQWLAAAQPTSLSSILLRHGLGRVHWIACGVRELRQTP